MLAHAAAQIQIRMAYTVSGQAELDCIHRVFERSITRLSGRALLRRPEQRRPEQVRASGQTAYREQNSSACNGECNLQASLSIFALESTVPLLQFVRACISVIFLLQSFLVIRTALHGVRKRLSSVLQISGSETRKIPSSMCIEMVTFRAIPL